MATTIPSRQLYINGQWAAPTRGGTLEVVNPATEQVIGHIPAGTAEDVDKAVAAARAAIKAGQWSKSTGAHRAKFLRAIAAKVRLNSERWLCAASATSRCSARAIACSGGCFGRRSTVARAKHPFPLPSRRGSTRPTSLGMRPWTAASLWTRRSGTWTTWRRALTSTRAWRRSSTRGRARPSTWA